jgi:hypothetical protein
MLDNIRHTRTLYLRAWRNHTNREQTMTTPTTSYNEHRAATVEQLETFRRFIEAASDEHLELLAFTAAAQLAHNEFPLGPSQRTACELVMEEMQYRRAEDSAQLAAEGDA